MSVERLEDGYMRNAAAHFAKVFCRDHDVIAVGVYPYTDYTDYTNYTPYTRYTIKSGESRENEYTAT